MAAFCEKARPSMINNSVEGIIEASESPHCPVSCILSPRPCHFPPSHPHLADHSVSSILPPVDKAAMLAHRALGAHLVETDNEGLKDNAFGWVDDSMAFIAPWGFSLNEIKVPVLLYQGSEDLMVPFGHGKWLAKKLPEEGLQVTLLEGEGHLSIFIGRETEMVGELLKAAGVGGR